MVFKKGEKKSVGKTGSQDATKDTTKRGPRKTMNKNRAETYSVYIYRVLK